MKIEIEIEEREINLIAAVKGEEFLVEEFKRDPQWFIANASAITAFTPRIFKAAK
jgi:hypothetical protein